MIYAALKGFVLSLLRAPKEPPEPPAGSHASVEVRRASPRFLTYRMVSFWIVSACGWSVVGLVLLAALLEQEIGAALLGFVLGGLVICLQIAAWFLIRIDYEMRYYIVTDRSLRVRQGAWTVREMTITYANVQNIRVVQGPLERLFGIWNLRIDTAGGGGIAGGQGGSHSIEMAGIEDAKDVRDGILEHLRALGAGAGLGDDDDDDRTTTARTAPLGSSPAVMDELRGLLAAATALRAAANSPPPTFEPG